MSSANEDILAGKSSKDAKKTPDIQGADDAMSPQAGQEPAAEEGGNRMNSAKAFFRAMYAGDEVDAEQYGMNVDTVKSNARSTCTSCANLSAQVEQLEARANELEGLYKRMAADFENYRKRIEREKDDLASTGIKLLVVITEGIPPLDTMKMVQEVKQQKAHLIGPNCPGIITPGQCLIGILPGSIFKSGPIGMISKSGTLTYEIALALTEANLGQSTCVGVGGDPIKGLDYQETLMLFENDPETKAIVLIGEIGGSAEEEAAAFIKAKIKKPVVGFIAGQTAPPGKRMGHAGAIVSAGKGTAESKIEALNAAGVKVAKTPAEVATHIGAVLSPVRH